MIISKRRRMMLMTTNVAVLRHLLIALFFAASSNEKVHGFCSPRPASRERPKSILSKAPNEANQQHGRFRLASSFASDPRNGFNATLSGFVPPSSNHKSRNSSSFGQVAGVTFNSVKSMLGTGMLALPMGLSVITDYTTGLLPATVLMLVLGVMSTYSFSIYGRLAHATQARSLGEMWKTIRKDDKRDTSLIISFANFAYCFGCCLAFSLILGDIFSSLAQGMVPGIPNWILSRQTAILAVTTGLIYPLCKLKSLTALAPVSLVGVVGSLLTIGFLGFRCPSVVSTSPYALGGAWATDATFGTFARLFSPAPLTLVSMSCITLMAHFSATEFYQSLVPKKHVKGLNPSEDASILRNYMTMTVASFSAVWIMNALALAFGFLTFGGSCSGHILNNYCLKDTGANISRLLCGISLIGSYPFCIRPCQSAGLELLGMKPTETNNRRMITGLIAVITAIALVVKNVGFVISMNGAVLGSNLVYTIPCLLFLKLTQGRTGNGRLKLERAISRLLVVFGVVATIAGTGAAITTSFFPHLLS